MLSLPHLGLAICLLILSLEDIRKGILRDEILLGVGGVALYLYGLSYWLSFLILSGIGSGLYLGTLALKGYEGIGWGDVKMMGVSGLWISPWDIPFFLILAGGMGIVVALIWRLVYKRLEFPLGPALALALWVCASGGPASSLGEVKMNYIFSGSSYGPAAGGKPESLVVLLHGYGADGEDLLSLGNSWSSLLPKTVFVAPDGPFECDTNPQGRQWFGVEDWNAERVIKEIQKITPAFNKYLDDLLKTYDLPPDRLGLVGFSQGSIVALHVALLRPQCAGVVAYSGAFLEDPRELKIAKPPVLLIHGTEDQVLSSELSQAAEAHLKRLGVPVKLSLLPGLEHQLDGRGLGMGGAFLQDVLSTSKKDSL